MNEDLSSIFEKLNINKDSINPDALNNIMGMLNNNSNTASSSDNSSNTTSNNSNAPDIDIETILRMKSIIDKMNIKNDDPRSELLKSLRPYLKESRQSKLDKYIQLLNMSKIIDILPFIGGENNGNK